MKPNEIKNGMSVKLINNPTQTYKVSKTIDKFLVLLSYDCDGIECLGGVMDISLIRKLRKNEN